MAGSTRRPRASRSPAGPTTLFDPTPGAVGSAFIIHANEDDQLTDATNGNSGARVACAVIEAE